MHDIGDMLVRAGFADPVMDQELLTLNWPMPEAALAELRTLGGNAAPDRAPGLRTPRWRQQLDDDLRSLADDGGRLSLTFEVVFGHAFKAVPRQPGPAETTVSLDEMRALARSPRSARAASLAAAVRCASAVQRTGSGGVAALNFIPRAAGTRAPACIGPCDRNACCRVLLPAVADGLHAPGRTEANVPESAGAMTMSAITLPSPFRVPSPPAGFRFGRESTLAGDDPLAVQWSVRWLLRRNCSLTPRQLLWFYLSLCAISFGIATMFWVQGVRLVMLFAWLELLALGAALLAYARHATDSETIALADDMLTVELACGSRVQRVAFQPHWVRVEPQHGATAR